MSAYAMGQLPPNSHVLDACAAPGLKTQVLSQLMGNKVRNSTAMQTSNLRVANRVVWLH